MDTKGKVNSPKHYSDQVKGAYQNKSHITAYNSSANVQFPSSAIISSGPDEPLNQLWSVIPIIPREHATPLFVGPGHLFVYG